MRLFCLEWKRMIKSRSNFVLLMIALLMSVVMAFLPVSFESINRPEENGGVTELNGLPAIRFKKNYYRDASGEITPQRMADALRTYQYYVREYGSVDDIPLDVYIENVMALRPVIKGLSEIYADPKTGIGADLTKIDPDEVEQHFYEQCASHLEDVMDFEQKGHPAARQFSMEKYTETNRPFRLYQGISRDAFDYTTLYILLLGVICTAIAAPVFANEYQTGSDAILRCTRYGRTRLALTKILTAGSIFMIVFLAGMAVHLSILNAAFGRECLETSFQMLFSIINLPDMDLGQLQIILVSAGLLSVLAGTGCTLFLSARCKDSLTVLLISIVILFLPIFAGNALGGSSWILTVLPSSGIGLKNNFLYQLCDFNFLHIGDRSFWTPYVILASAALEVPVFLILAVLAYNRHQTL